MQSLSLTFFFLVITAKVILGSPPSQESIQANNRALMEWAHREESIKMLQYPDNPSDQNLNDILKKNALPSDLFVMPTAIEYIVRQYGLENEKVVAGNRINSALYMVYRLSSTRNIAFMCQDRHDQHGNTQTIAYNSFLMGPWKTDDIRRALDRFPQIERNPPQENVVKKSEKHDNGNEISTIINHVNMKITDYPQRKIIFTLVREVENGFVINNIKKVYTTSEELAKELANIENNNPGVKGVVFLKLYDRNSQFSFKDISDKIFTYVVEFDCIAIQ